MEVFHLKSGLKAVPNNPAPIKDKVLQRQIDDIISHFKGWPCSFIVVS